jgi:hypothetical protein
MVNDSLSIPVIVYPLIQIAPTQATLQASETREFLARIANSPNGALNQQTITLTAARGADPTLTANAVITLLERPRWMSYLS